MILRLMSDAGVGTSAHFGKPDALAQAPTRTGTRCARTVVLRDHAAVLDDVRFVAGKEIDHAVAVDNRTTPCLPDAPAGSEKGAVRIEVLDSGNGGDAACTRRAEHRRRPLEIGRVVGENPTLEEISAKSNHALSLRNRQRGPLHRDPGVGGFERHESRIYFH